MRYLGRVLNYFRKFLVTLSLFDIGADRVVSMFELFSILIFSYVLLTIHICLNMYTYLPHVIALHMCLLEFILLLRKHFQFKIK